MAACLSFTALMDRYHRLYFVSAGMKSTLVQLGEGTIMHCWAPKKTTKKGALVLIHGLGANAMWQWRSQIRPLLAHFNLYVPDLVFFGKSFTTRSERTESFQAQCVMKMLESLGVTKFHLVGVSYGGFVAYSLAHLYPHAVQKMVLVCSGVCMEEDIEEGHLKTSDLTTAISILLPQTTANMRTLIKLSFSKPPKMMPSCLLQDFIQTMNTQNRERKIELINSLIAGKKDSTVPVISQETLIIWGEHDQIFPLELGHRLKRHLGDRASLVVLKDAGHAVHLEKSNEFNKQIKEFLLGSR